MNPTTAIALASLIIAVLSTIIMLFGQRRTATATFVSGLETRIASLEGELERAEERIKVLEDHNGVLLRENIELLRQIARKSGG